MAVPTFGMGLVMGVFGYRMTRQAAMMPPSRDAGSWRLMGRVLMGCGGAIVAVAIVLGIVWLRR